MPFLKFFLVHVTKKKDQSHEVDIRICRMWIIMPILTFFCCGQTLETEFVTCKDVQTWCLFLGKAPTLLSNKTHSLKGYDWKNFKIKSKFGYLIVLSQVCIQF